MLQGAETFIERHADAERWIPWVALVLSLLLHVLRGGRWVGRNEAATGDFRRWRADLEVRLKPLEGLRERWDGLRTELDRLWARTDTDHEKHKAGEQKVRDDLVEYIDRVEARVVQQARDGFAAIDARLDRLQADHSRGRR